MIQVRLSTNTERKTITVDPETSIRNVLEDNNIDYSRTPIYLDGAPLEAGSMDKTFADYNIAEHCVLTAIVKTNNA